MVFLDAVLLSGAPILLLGTGVLAGLYHAFEPDHVATMMTVMTARRQRASKVKLSHIVRVGADCLKNSLHGLLWGFGHASAIFLMVVIVFVFSPSIPELLFAWFELAVGIMMVVLGLSLFFNRALWKRRLHLHPHRHEDGTFHTHPHDHDVQHRHGHRSYVVGCIHGLAGSGGLVILATSTMDGTHTSMLLFASIFGAGSIAGMIVVTSILYILLLQTNSVERARSIIRYVAGSVAVVFGLYIISNVVASGELLSLAKISG